MLPLFDLMMQAQNGQATDLMAKQFGLAQEQLQKAFAALTPAFSAGFKRSTANPYDFSSLMQSMFSGNYAQYFEDLNKAFTSQGLQDGNTVLAQIFGSKEVSRAIAAQAGQMTGISQKILKKMMPVMATAMMGGLFKELASQFQAAGDALSAGDTTRFFQTWMAAAGLAEKPQAAPPPSIYENPFLRAFQDMMTPPGATSTSAKTAADVMAANPFLQAFSAMMAGGAGTKAEEQQKPEATDAGQLGALFNQMFESGLEVQKSYQKSLETIIGGNFAHRQDES